MICVTLGRGRHSALIQEWKDAAEAGAELVELRLDCLRREPDLKRILKERYTPVLITVRRGVDGGIFRGDEEKRQRLLREAIVSGVDMVDLEVDIAGKIPRFGKTKRIVSYHNFKKTPTELPEIMQKAKELNADYFKFATAAHSLDDSIRVLEAVESASIPTIGIGMGEKGFFTRILNKKFGSPMTFAGFNPDRTFAPGMPSFLDVKRDYFYDRIDANSEIYAVLGDPIGHSLSPAVHNAAFRHLGLNKVYVPILASSGELKASLETLSWLGAKGYSVTIPHKETVVPLLDRAEKAVDVTGACNTLLVNDGKFYGMNTDCDAAIEVLEERLGGLQSGLSPLMDKQVLILGAGGVARSIASGLVRRGAGVMISARDDERAGKLAATSQCRSVSWAMRASTITDILINCTPVGMHPDVDHSPTPPAAFRPGMIAFDTVYRPENTMFIKMARVRECQAITGVEMFIRQAARQFEAFTGLPAPVEVMTEALKRKTGTVSA